MARCQSGSRHRRRDLASANGRLRALSVHSIRRNGTDVPPELLLVGDLDELAMFALLTSWASLARRDAATHKRLMILGTVALWSWRLLVCSCCLAARLFRSGFDLR